jgi:hypothetical protein
MQDIWNGPVTERMITLATQIAYETIECNCPSSLALPNLSCYIRHLSRRSNLNAATFLTMLVYLSRLRYRLSADRKTARGIECTTHRLFLASFLIANKYLNDVPIKNTHWYFLYFVVVMLKVPISVSIHHC